MSGRVSLRQRLRCKVIDDLQPFKAQRCDKTAFGKGPVIVCHLDKITLNRAGHGHAGSGDGNLLQGCIGLYRRFKGREVAAKHTAMRCQRTIILNDGKAHIRAPDINRNKRHANNTLTGQPLAAARF